MVPRRPSPDTRRIESRALEGQEVANAPCVARRPRRPGGLGGLGTGRQRPATRSVSGQASRSFETRSPETRSPSETRPESRPESRPETRPESRPESTSGVTPRVTPRVTLRVTPRVKLRVNVPPRSGRDPTLRKQNGSPAKRGRTRGFSGEKSQRKRGSSYSSSSPPPWMRQPACMNHVSGATRGGP